MHRTQILLEPWQYDALKSRAATQGKSLSGLIRDAVSVWLSQVPSKAGDSGGAKGIEGIVSDPSTHGEKHDEHLYGPSLPRWKKKLKRIEGIGHSGGASGRDHDKYIYRPRG